MKWYVILLAVFFCYMVGAVISACIAMNWTAPGEDDVAIKLAMLWWLWLLLKMWEATKWFIMFLPRLIYRRIGKRVDTE